MKKRLVSGLLTIALLIVPMTSFGLDTAEIFTEKAYKEGVETQEVKYIQRALFASGFYFDNTFDGDFGEKTLNAVKSFQSAYDLTADGVVGSGTLGKMEELGLFPELTQDVYKNGMEDPEIMVLQEALALDGVLNIDQYTSYFGNLTEVAVIDFQKKYNLDADGIVGQGTIDKMIELGLVVGKTEEETVMDAFTVSEEPQNSNFLGNLSMAVYKKGLNIADVIVIQKAMAAEGVFFEEEFTTYYGEKTEEAVMAFQAKYGMEADGVLGEESLNKLKDLGYVTRNLVTSRAPGERVYGEYLHWQDVMKMFTKKSTVLTIEDFLTGTTYNVLVGYGSNHADIEPLTLRDAMIMKELWGGEFSWARRPVLVHFNGRVIAGSLNGMPHAGVENAPADTYVSGRSAGYGYGYNYDYVKGNGVDGHMCLHFKGSLLHKNNKQDPKHQQAVKTAAGL